MALFKCTNANCGAMVEFHRTNCEFGHFIGFPNVRRAEEMRADLERNYEAARRDAAARGVEPQVDELETLLLRTVATINIGAKLLRNMAFGQNYMSYYKAMEIGSRKIAERQYHSHRGAVDEKVHPGYREEIINAALSPDGRGLTNYGAITLQLEGHAIEDRASVMRENAFDFFERYDLGRRNAEEEPGWRAVWADRARLGVAHLAATLTHATALDRISDAILSSGGGRDRDRYIEVHVYGEVSPQSLGQVTLEKPLTDPQDKDDWDGAQQKLTKGGVKVIDRTQP